MLESARDLTIEAAVLASARFADTLPAVVGRAEITKLLNLRNERDVLSGMKCVLALVSRGDAAGEAVTYFGDVVKNVTCRNLQVKRLVLVYLARYGELEPDTALLLINTIQKLLGDKDARLRAAAIRALAAIRIGSIAPIVVLSVVRVLLDAHPDVRAAAAMAVGTLWELQPPPLRRHRRQLLEVLAKLLGDHNAAVVGAAVKLYARVRGQIEPRRRWDAVHRCYRRLCRALPQLDPWAQAFLVDVLVEYARRFLARGDADLALFLDALAPLVHSDAEFVVLSVCRAVVAVGTMQRLVDLGLPAVVARMVALQSVEVRCFGLRQAVELVRSERAVAAAASEVGVTAAFRLLYRRFFVFPSDAAAVCRLKLRLLLLLADEATMPAIFEELKYYVFHARDAATTRAAFACMGRCLQISSLWSQRILRWCLCQVLRTTGGVLNELLTVVRFLLQQQRAEAASARTVYRLSLLLCQDLPADARATIIWIVGEFTVECANQIGPDVLRRLIGGFALEDATVRYQLLVLAAKIMAYELSQCADAATALDSVEGRMFSHVLRLARYDSSYDTRDRARTLSVLMLAEHLELQLAVLFLQAPKAPPLERLEGADTLDLFGLYFEIPDWADPATHPPASVRDEAVEAAGDVPVVTAISSLSFGALPPPSSHAVSSTQAQPLAAPKQTYKLQSLDEFFGDESEESESESESSESEVGSDESEAEESEELEDEDEEDEGVEDEDDEDEDEDEDDEDEDVADQSEENLTRPLMREF